MMSQPSEQDYRSLMHRALLELRQMRAKLDEAERTKTEPIAIVGIGCRFPGANNPEAFWRLLRDGVDAIAEVPGDRWNVDAYYDPNPDTPGKMYTRSGGFVDHLHEFDANFFGIAPREALSLDPQQRLLLEVSWEALEQAGIVPDRLADSPTGVFVGISSNDYSHQLLTRAVTDIDAYLATGNSHSTAAGRLSYTLGLTGPCLAIDTACSSSLVAVHLACQSLRNGDCRFALAGGVNRILSPEFSINFSRARMLAADGRCKTFDARADGFVRGEGCGIVVLQRLSDAIADGNPIFALIRGSAINQDGRSSGLTVPNGPSQQLVIQQALANAQVNPAEVSYIEAHGTGTALGDPIEVGALAAVFGQHHTPDQPLQIGSVKTNIGHLEAAAGIAGMIKVVLTLQHQEIPPHLHFQQPNPYITWETLPVAIPTSRTPWMQESRIAGVSSFGFSGTNAHVVLEAYYQSSELSENPKSSSVAAQSAIQNPKSTDRPHLLTLSAKTPAALRELALRYQAYLSEHVTVPFEDVCYSASTGRSHFEHRLCVIADSSEEAVEKLAHFIEGQPAIDVIHGQSGKAIAALNGRNSSSQLSASQSNSTESDRLRHIAQLYVQGTEIDWQDFYRQSGQGDRHRVILPTYPFQRQRYWIDRAHPIHQAVDSLHPLLGHKLNLSRSQSIYFENYISQTVPVFLEHHRVFAAVVLPAAAYIEMALAAAKIILHTEHLRVASVDLQQAMVLANGKEQKIQTILTQNQNREYNFEILSLANENDSESDWIVHATGKIYAADEDSFPSFDLASKQTECDRSIDINTYYQTLRERGIDHGKSFQALQQLWQGDGQALGYVQLPEELITDTSNYNLHPVLLDAALQVIGAALDPESGLYLPIGLERLTYYEQPEGSLWSYTHIRPSPNKNSELLTVDLQLMTAQGEMIAALEGVKLKRVRSEQFNQESPEDNLENWFYTVEWKPQERTDEQRRLHHLPSSDVSDILILSDQQGMGQALAKQLEAQGQSCILVSLGEEYRQFNQRQYQINPECLADFQQLLETILATQPMPMAIVYLWSLDAPQIDRLNGEQLETLTTIECTRITHLVQALITSKPSHSNPSDSLSQLYLVTQNSVSTGLEQHPLEIIQSPIWGIGKVTALEHPELRCTRIDLDLTVPCSEQAQALLVEIRSASQDDQVVFRDRMRYVPRLTQYSSSTRTDEITLEIPIDQPFHLTASTRGTTDSLSFQPTARRSPAADEVEIQVQATGLNFIDVLDLLGLLPFERHWFGVECVGEVVAIGAAVTDFAIGDAVIALAPESFSRYVTTNAALVAPKPRNLTPEAAATIPANFLTAYYALHHVARIQQGDRILIHAGASGTGMAAVQLAQRAGAEVFATASPAKWEALRAIGVQHIMNSRTLDFAAEVLELTQGEGVDVVFNSLSGEFIPQSLAVLRDKGKFLEIGKRGIWSAEQVKQVKAGVTYSVIDLLTTAQQQPELMRSMLHHLIQQFQAGDLQPPPTIVFPFQQTIQAFRTMQQAKHVGKIVVSQSAGLIPPPPLSKGGKEENARSTRLPIRSNSTYLITGGLGGLGLVTAQWLVQQGATHLGLVSRRQPSAEAETELRSLEQEGVQVRVLQADVSVRSQLTEVFSTLEQFPPLRGVIHAAGVLDDGTLLQMNASRFAYVLAPKVAGAWNLHTLTQDKPLDFFVLFSSAAALFGSPGQANHVVANTFLDALAHYRQSLGLPGLSINWGAWSEVGAAAKRQVEQQMRLRGVGSIAPQQGVRALEYVLMQSSAQVGVIPINWTQFLQQGISSPFFANFLQSSQPQSQERSQIRQQLEQADAADRPMLLVAHLQAEVGKVLGSAPSQLPSPQQGFFDLGMDSLMAVELRHRLETSLTISIPSTVIFEYPTIHDLAHHLIHQVLPLDSAIEPIATSTQLSLPNPEPIITPPEPAQNPPPQSLDSAEIDASIAAELAALETLLNRH